MDGIKAVGVVDMLAQQFKNPLKVELLSATPAVSAGKRVGLKVNSNKAELLSLIDHRTFPFCIKLQSIEGVEHCG